MIIGYSNCLKHSLRKFKQKVWWKLRYSAILYNYFFYRNRRAVRSKYAKQVENIVNNAISNTSSDHICVTYNNLYSPPTYGDFFTVIMLVRYFAALGKKIDFVIDDQIPRRSDWAELGDIPEQEFFVREQESLARFVLYDFEKVKVMTKRHPNNKVYELNRSLDESETPLYTLAPLILEEAIFYNGQKLPNSFLLESRRDNLKKFVAIHVRFGKWDPARDTNVSALRSDIKLINKNFPGYDIVIFSSRRELRKIFEEAFGKEYPNPVDFNGITIRPQRNDGFLLALVEISECSFYFQRLGGGMSVAAIYSSIPYLILEPSFTYFYGREKIFLTSWASRTQQFRSRIPGRIHLKRILKKQYG